MDYAVAHLKGEIKSSAAVFQLFHDAQALREMSEIRVEIFLQNAFAGMSEGGMPEIMPERRRLAEILIESQTARYSLCNLRHFKRMRQPRSVVVVLGREENLRLVHEPAKGFRMDYPVPVTLKCRANLTRRDGFLSSPRIFRKARVL